MTSVAAVVLAAGRSSRFLAAGGEEETKLLARFDGEPLVRRVVSAALASRARPVVVVVGHARQAVEAALVNLPAKIVFNPDYLDGLSTSLRAGLLALPPGADAAAILLGDMPMVASRLIDALIEAFEARPGARAAAPMEGGRRRNPVLIARALFPGAMAVSGDEGARTLLAALNPTEMIEIEAGGWTTALDVDTPDDLANLRRLKQERSPNLA